MSYWKNYWNNIAASSSSFKQVQRDAINTAQMEEICAHISQTINLKKSDALLDVCCGNGLISSELAKKCKSVVAVDFSETLIKAAKKSHQQNNIEYFIEDALTLSKSVDKKCDKIVLYFSFQYFNFNEGTKVIGELKKRLKPGGVIFIGDVPNSSCFWSYYNTLAKRLFYFKQWLFKQPKMGKFWSEKEILTIAKKNGLKAEMHTQPKHLPHAHYRFDVIFTED